MTPHIQVLTAVANLRGIHRMLPAGELKLRLNCEIQRLEAAVVEQTGQGGDTEHQARTVLRAAAGGKPLR